MKRINFPLLFGSIIVIFLIIVSFYPSLFTSQDPLYETKQKYIEYKKNGEWVEEFAYNPMRPNRENLLGTDDAGRDIYSRLIYGTRNTLKLALLVAVFRMALALPMGLAAGMGMKFISGIIKIFNTYFTAIPMLIFCFIVLNIDYFRMLQMDSSILAFAIVLTIVGWGKLAGMIEDSTRIIMEEDFIEGEVAIGKTKLQIAYQNILPHIIPTGVSLFFKEMGMALFLVAQLAILFIFVGVRRFPKSLAFKANYISNLEPEWGGMLSRIAVDVKKFDTVYWMTLYPVLVFSIAVIGINLMGEGLRIEFQKRNSKFISYIRKTYYQLSPMLFISQIRNFREYYKPVIIKSLIIISLIAYFVVPWNPSPYKFDLNQAKIHLEELTDKKYQGRVPGTEGGYLSGEYIINTLKSYGYEVETMEIPLSDASLNSEANLEVSMPLQLSPVLIESGWIKLVDEQGQEKTYYLHKDFTIGSIDEKVFTDISREQLHYKGIASDKENAINVPEGESFFAINHGSEYLALPFDTQGIFFADYTFSSPSYISIDNGKRLYYDIEFRVLEEEYSRNSNPCVYKITTIIPFGDLRKELESGYREVEISFDFPKVAEYPARNIMAFMPGKDRTKENPGELIIIGASYDGAYNNGDDQYVMTASPAAIALELARKISSLDEPLPKSIEFVFWDNESESIKYTSLDGPVYYSITKLRPVEMANKHGYYYIDINYPGYNRDKYLNLITLPAQRTDGNNYLVGLGIEKRFKQMDIKYRRFHYGMRNSGAMIQMPLNALTSIGLGNPSTEGINTARDNLDNINYQRMEDIGQTILDTLTMNTHIMEHKAFVGQKGFLGENGFE